MKSSKLIALALIILSFIWIGSVFLSAAPSNNASNESIDETKQEKEKLFQVRIREISPDLYRDEISVTGRTRASRQIEIKAQLAGQINKIHKEEGENVQANDLIAELELREYGARVEEAQKRVEQRRIEYNAAKKLAGQGFNSKVTLASALADLENAKANLKQASTDFKNTKIQAPFEGIIFEQNIEDGDYVNIGDSLFSIVDLDPIEVTVFVSEREVQYVRMGQISKITFLNGQTLTGKVSFISPSANDETRTFRVTVSAENKDLKFYDGLTAKVSIPANNMQAYRISPSILSLNTAGIVGIKIVDENNKVRFMPIKIVADEQEAMWVEGPEGTVRVITVGQDFVIEGQEVNPVVAQGDSLL